MTRPQLIDNWMTIGTNNKLLKRPSGKGRVLIGEKGLGRLGLDRLCQSTRLQTFSVSEANGSELQIDWGKYETAIGRLESVTHDLYRLPNKTMWNPISG